MVADQAQRFPALDAALGSDGRAAARSRAGRSERPVRDPPRAAPRSGLRVHEVGLVTDVDERARAGARGRGAARPSGARRGAGCRDRARAQTRLAAAARKGSATALLVERRGYTAGPAEPGGGAAARRRAIGCRRARRADYGGFVPLEKLLVLRPDMLVLHDPVIGGRRPGRALPRRIRRSPRSIRPSGGSCCRRRFALCGGPALVAALDYLAEALAKRTAETTMPALDAPPPPTRR